MDHASCSLANSTVYFVQVFTEKLQRLPKSKMLDLFQKEYIRAVIVSVLKKKNPAVLLHTLCCFLKLGWLHAQAGVGLMALQQLGGVNGVLFYASEVFVSAGNDQSEKEKRKKRLTHRHYTTLALML